MQTQGKAAKVDIDSNLNSGLNSGPRSCENLKPQSATLLFLTIDLSAKSGAYRKITHIKVTLY